MRGEFNEAVTAVVVDSSPLRLQLYKALLAQWQVDVVAVSQTAERAADLAEVSACELSVIDAGESPDSRTLYRFLRRAHKRCPELISVVLVEDAEQVLVESALAAGACATVDRSRTRVRQRVWSRRPSRPTGSCLRGRAQACRLGTRLTRREIEILRLVAEGRSNREVGQLLWVTDQTVKFHLANAYRKLGVRNRFEASQWAITRGLVKAGHGQIAGQRLRPAGSRG